MIGKKEFKVSLNTKEPAEAKLRFAAKYAETLAHWTKLKEGAGDRLSDRQVVGLSGEIYRAALAKWDDRPEEMAEAYLLRGLSVGIAADQLTPSGQSRGGKQIGPALEELIGKEVNEALARHRLTIDAETRGRLLQRSADALQQAWGQAAREAIGQYRPDPLANRFPAFVPPPSPISPVVDKPKPPTDSKEFFKAVMGKREATAKRWGPILQGLMDSAKQTDIRHITTDDIRLWMKRGLATGKISERSFKRNNLTAIKTLFKIAYEDEVIPSDPAHRVKLRIAKNDTGRSMRGFFTEERNKILAATLEPPSKRLTWYNAAARRWVPWLCAYTGARVNEITQVRACDIQNRDGYWCIRITPEAGTQKSLNVRWVPLHAHLIEQGFLEFAQAKTGDTPLFTPVDDGTRKGKTMRMSERVGAHLAKWVRELGIHDQDVAPNHGWRHWWKTESRAYPIKVPVADAIQGHAPATQSDEYGGFPPRIMGPAIKRFKKIRLPNAADKEA
nr:hypothetical protein [Methylobacterium sp. ZNC0032]